MSDTAITVIVSLLCTGAVTIIGGMFHRSLVQAKVKSIISGTYDKLINTLNEQVEALQKDVERLRERLDHLYKKELEYLATIRALTEERNTLQIEIARKDQVLKRLQGGGNQGSQRRNRNKNQ